jgi:hypothetical protein
MPDFQKTYEIFERAGYTDFLKKDPPAWIMEYNHFKEWYRKITDPNTVDPNTNIRLPRRDTSIPNREYPIKFVNAIKRVQTAEGEVLLSNQRWIGRTSLQNDLPINLDNYEMWDEPIFNREHRVNPKDSTDIITAIVGVDGWIRHYTLRFSEENLQKLLEMSDPNQPPSLVAADFRATGQQPRPVDSIEDLKNKPLAELLNPKLPVPQQQQPQQQPMTAQV